MPADVTVYTTRSCPYCSAAKELLRSKGVAFKEIDVTSDDAMRDKLVRMSGGRQTVPVIFAGSKCVGGYDELEALYRGGGSL